MKQNLTLGAAVVAVVLAIIGFLAHGSAPVMKAPKLGGVTNYDTLTLGVPPSGDSSTVTGSLSAAGTVYAGQGVFEGGVNSTTTAANMTMKTSDFNSVSLLSVIPTVGNITMTLPSTTTDSTFLPQVGDCGWLVVTNATSTQIGVITFAGGSSSSGGYILQSASSTLTRLGVAPGNSATVRMCRKVNTDILVDFLPYTS